MKKIKMHQAVAALEYLQESINGLEQFLADTGMADQQSVVSHPAATTKPDKFQTVPEQIVSASVKIDVLLVRMHLKLKSVAAANKLNSEAANKDVATVAA